MNKIITCLLAIIVAGCGGGNSNSAADISTDIKGEWVSHCHELIDADEGSFIAYIKDTFIFTDASYTQKSIAYSDQACTITTGDTDTWYGTYDVTQIVTLNDGSRAREINFIVSSDEWPDNIQNTLISSFYVTDNITLNFGKDSGIIYEVTYSKI